ncbi:MAG: glycine-rich domain-containing protein [Patescibacteria group bacterium]|jgi:hypothetical protein
MRTLTIRIDMDSVARRAAWCRRVFWSGCKKAAKVSRFLLVLTIMTSWIFSDWPRLGHNPFFPNVREAKASAEIFYQSSTIAYDPYTLDGGATAAFDTSGTFDNEFSSEITLPFTFTFYGTDYDSVWISSNGFVSFTGDTPGSSTNTQVIPDAATPNALIAAVWADLYASSSNGSQIRYQTFGSTPNRVFVVDFLDLAQCCEEGIPRVTTQVQMYEATSIIEVHSEVVVLNSPGSYYTQGVENADGTAGTATKNGTDDFAVDLGAVRFRPTGGYEERYTTGSVVYTSSTTWTAPTGVTAVNVEAWGAGGAGGGNTQASADSGGGGGGGAYAKKSNISVTPGNGYTVVVGAGGTGVASSAGNAGGDSYFIDSSTVMAKGGGGGGASTGDAGTAGTGGASGSSVGDVTYSGGTGGAGRNSTTGIGGGGGGGAGTTSAGNNGTAATVTGATAVVGGGPGGYGFTVAGNGLAPDIGPGGGGGGSGEGATAQGGDGAPGRVRITYIYTWTAPTGVTSVDVEVWGGGGGGGGQQRIVSDGGGGGGGGGYSKKTSISVTPGNTYAVGVGAGGLGGTCITGVAGDDSYFIDTSTVMAKGGSGGPNSTGTPGSGGAGGAAASGVGDTKFSGGNGGKGSNATDGRGGPGGSSAGVAANGTNGPTTWAIDDASKPPHGGGIGGDGGDADGVPGDPPLSNFGSGGGGGGAADALSTTTCSIGGQGADGKVAITYIADSSDTVDTYATGSVVYTSSATWTAPAGVTAVNVEAWGGGGAGGGNNDSANDGGGGGGGGAYAKKSNISVTPGNDYTVVVGAGGTGVASSAGNAGGDSYFIDASTVMAKGGSGGNPNVGSGGSGTGGSGGAGGAGGSSVGDTTYTGGNGRAGTNSATGAGGGGGSAAGTGSAGTNASTAPTGAVAVVGGGPGGYGTATSGTTDGLAPDIGPGGGGGGAAEGATVKGGDGYVGRVRITYVYTWTAPTGVTSVDVEVWGGGGGGGGQQRIISDGGGGGGGGGYSKNTVAVTAGNTYTVVAGGGGLGGTCLSGLSGEDSYFVDASTVMAKGGAGGANSTGTPPAGGSGGASSGGVSEPSYIASGGDGGVGYNNTNGYGGPGGSSAGIAANGTSGATTWTTATAAAAPSGGGIGGDGASAIATNGNAPASGSGGGGGGGGESASTSTCTIGGAGADGKVKLSYVASGNAAPTISVSQPDGTSDTVTVGDSYNVTYTLADSDDVVTAAFYYDTNNSGLDGTVISGPCATAAEGTGVTCAWDTTGVTTGSYYVYGVVDDGENSPVSAYSSGQITINPATIVAVTVGDGTVAYGIMGTSETRSTSTGMWDTQSATNTGNVAEDFTIRGTNTANWTLGATPSSEQYAHAFCTASCTTAPTNYTALTTGETSMVTNVAVDAAQLFDLNISTPTSTSYNTQQSVDVVITATQH